MEIKCYKGAKTNDEITITVDGMNDTYLAEVRSILTKEEFISPDQGQTMAYRFIFAQISSQSMNIKDLYVALDTEKYIPVSAVLGYENQVILSNIYADHAPDLAGFGCTWWFNRYISARCILNTYDEGAIEKNKKRKAFQPIMLNDVIAVSEQNTMKAVRYPNVCLCVEGSVVGFEISSWGAVGFQYQVAPTAGDAIVEDLYKTFGGNPGSYATSHPRCWEKTGNAIEIWSTSRLDNIIPGQSLAYQKIVIRTRSVTSYKQNGQTYSSSLQPPMTMAPGRTNVFLLGQSISEADLRHELATAGQNNSEARDVTVIDGDSITPGTATQGDASNEEHGTIYDVQTTSWDDALGEIPIYFFVFKSEEEALNTIGRLGAANPDIWK